MREKIIERLRAMESAENVVILFAVESGSRAWGFASPDSDYDIRFVYVRPAAWYLGLEKRRDVLEYPIDKVWDVNGWDLQKALRLLHSSNPTLLEWLHSPIVYLTSPWAGELQNAGKQYFKKRAGLHHYLNMARNNLEASLCGGQIQVKKYFYALRPVLACWWILEHGTPPPVPFGDLCKSQLPAALQKEAGRLLEKKQNLEESGLTARVKELDQYIGESIEEISRRTSLLPKEEESGWEELNQLFLRASGQEGGER